MSRTKKYWRMTAGEVGELATDWIEKDVVTTAWANEIGDFREQSTDELIKNSQESGTRRQVERFLGMTKEGDGMSEGDVVIAYAPSPFKMVIGVGEVDKPEYEESPNLVLEDHKYQRSVTWYDWGTPVRISDLPSGCPQVYTPRTLAEFHQSRDDIESGIKKADKVPTEELESVLSLGSDESDMDRWVMRNLQKLDSDISFNQHESSVSVGDIDILAEDANGWVVIENKKGEAGDKAVGQVTGYISAIKQETNTDARGILIAEEFKSRVKQAASDDESLELYRLKLNPSFEPVAGEGQ
jgi:Holliday junction resolvase-like predicted endonuclease